MCAGGVSIQWHVSGRAAHPGSQLSEGVGQGSLALQILVLSLLRRSLSDTISGVFSLIGSPI